MKGRGMRGDETGMLLPWSWVFSVEGKFPEETRKPSIGDSLDDRPRWGMIFYSV